MLSPRQIMTRLLLTFENVFQVLKAEKLLKDRARCRPVPTPSGLASSICSICIELLEPAQEEAAVAFLKESSLSPKGVHHL